MLKTSLFYHKMLKKSVVRRFLRLVIEKIHHKTRLLVTLKCLKPQAYINHLNCVSMKNYALFFIMVAGAFSCSCFAQSNDHFLDNGKMEDTQITLNNDLAVVSYHVEERVNMKFGGSVTTYDVPSLNMISTKDLGENNIRIITPKYAKIRAKLVAVTASTEGKIKNSTADITTKPIKTDVVVTTERKKEYVNIDVIDTYERVMDKGFKSVTMMTKVADRHFFEGDLVLAAKWYTELFNATTSELEAVYYYRYGQSLIATGQVEKGNAMMKIFESKSL